MPDEIVHRPDPDPTTLTTSQLRREIGMVRELVDAQLHGLVTRLDGMDKAVELLQKYPTEVDRAVGRLQALHEEKFVSVDSRFTESDKAVQAALAAAERAAGKNEMNTTKQIDSLIALINTKNAASDDKVDDIRNRVTVVESLKKGGDQNLGTIFGAIGALAGVAAILGFAMLLITK